jgi:hypothetical protein
VKDGIIETDDPLIELTENYGQVVDTPLPSRCPTASGRASTAVVRVCTMVAVVWLTEDVHHDISGGAAKRLLLPMAGSQTDPGQ